MNVRVCSDNIHINIHGCEVFTGTRRSDNGRTVSYLKWYINGDKTVVRVQARAGTIDGMAPATFLDSWFDYCTLAEVKVFTDFLSQYGFILWTDMDDDLWTEAEEQEDAYYKRWDTEIARLERDNALLQANVTALEDEVAGLKKDLCQMTLSRDGNVQSRDLWLEQATYLYDKANELKAELSKARGVAHAQVDRNRQFAEKISRLESALSQEKQDHMNSVLSLAMVLETVVTGT